MGRAITVGGCAILVACGAIGPDGDAGTGDDATVDVLDSMPDTTVDVALVDAPVDTLDDSPVADASDATADGGAVDATADAPQDAGPDVYFNAIPDASGCTYYWDAGCTKIPKPVSIDAGCVASPPTPLGGTIVPGVYHLTKVDWNMQTFDGGCFANTTHGGNLEICGNVIQHYDVNEVQSVFVGNLVYQTLGDQLELNQYCPSGPYFASFGYTATSTEIVINWGNPVVLIETFTKQ